MNKRSVLFWVVYTFKVLAIVVVVFPVIMWVVVYLYTSLMSEPPTHELARYTGFTLLAVMGFMTGGWTIGHRQAIDDYFDSLEDADDQ